MKLRPMWLVTFLALLMIPTLGHSWALAPGSKAVARGNPISGSGPLTVLARADTGFLIYYGHELKPPYIFGTDGKKLFLRCPGDSAVKASGYEWIPWLIPPEQKAPPPMSADAAAEFDAQRRLLQHVQDVSRQCQRQGLRGRALMH